MHAIALFINSPTPVLTRTSFLRNTLLTHIRPALPLARPLARPIRLQNRATASAASHPVAPHPAAARPVTMKYNRLGSSDLLVSEVCLGTMTWGVQNTEQEAHAQIDYARSRGVNFLDTAEIYPVPGSAPGQVSGLSEQIIGTYLAAHKDIRADLIIATKVMGFSKESKTVANRVESKLPGPFPDSRQDRESILAACDASLRRLQTDYIDLYQLHWPDRYVPIFGSRSYNPERERDAIPIRDILLTLKTLLDNGKIRAYGLSNETTFGLCEFVRLADELGMPRPATIQNSFCLLDRRFESELAEACAPRNFNVGLLPWSILAGGALTGKYNGKIDSKEKPLHPSIVDSRFVLFPSFQGRYVGEEAREATAAYMRIAADHGMSPATLAQAFCKSRWFIPSSIIGATKLDQLKENLDAFDAVLNEKIFAQIDEIHNRNKDCVVVQ